MTKTYPLQVVVGIVATLLALAAPASLQAQGQSDNAALEFSDLEAKADEVVKVNLWGRPLEQAKKLLGLRKNVTASVRSFMSGLTAVYRRTYRFRKGGASEDDVRPVHQQLAEDGWVPLIEAADRDKPQSLSVYSYYDNDQVAGMTVVSTDSDEVTVLKIIGPVDFEALSEIGSGLGLPVMNVATTEIQELSSQTTGR
ncbi:MAG: DUF4252 domain-containing protein [Acidobacteriia bacterium]|nr:DUF4252 domain-containing protein [Terriglobia bacterium]